MTLGVGASYDYYSSSEGFLAFFFSTALTAGDLTLVTFGFSSSLSSSDYYFAAFLVGKTLATGDLTLARVFLGFSSSDSYSSEDSLAFFF